MSPSLCDVPPVFMVHVHISMTAGHASYRGGQAGREEGKPLKDRIEMIERRTRNEKGNQLVFKESNI